jgi:dipeptidyl aminopeptidase/acylaminoacyl peptidase
MTLKNRFLTAVVCSFTLVSLNPLIAADGNTSTMSLEDIVTLKRVGQARMSPNGDAIAYLLAVPRTLYEDDDGGAWVQLHVVNLDGESRPYFSGDVSVSSVAWSTDGNSLYFVASRDPEAPYPNIFEIPLNGGEAQVIYEGQSGIGSIFPSPDGASLAFLAAEPRPESDKDLAAKGFKAVVYEESVQSKRVWLLDLDSGEALAQDLPGSASDFAWSPDGEHYAVALAPTPLVDDSYNARDVFVINTSDATVRNQLGSVGKLGHFDWSPDGKRIAYIGSESINDPSPGRLYVTSSSGGERNDLIPDYQAHVQDFYWLDDNNISFMSARGVWSEFGNASLQSIAPAGEAPASGPILRSVDALPGQRVAAAVADTPVHPTEVFLLSPGAEPRRLTHSNPWLEERQFGAQEAVTFRARDGLELEAVVIHPVEGTVNIPMDGCRAMRNPPRQWRRRVMSSCIRTTGAVLAVASLFQKWVNMPMPVRSLMTWWMPRLIW